MLLRSALVAASAAAFCAAPAAGSSGGTSLPGGAQATPATPPEPDTSTLAESTPAAEPVAIAPAVPSLPVLATAARRADDPVTQDLTALGEPTAIAAIDGHVVIVRARGGRSELVDVADPAVPRVLLASTRAFGMPHAGRDAGGRAVIVASPCAGADAVVRLGGAPRCPLRAVDLESGASRPLPSTTGALAGDLSDDRLVFTRSSPSAGVRLYESLAGAPATALAMPRLGKPGDGWTPASGRPIAGSLRAGGFDIDASGRIAVVLEFRALTPRFSSGLCLRSATGVWSRPATVTTTFTGLGTRHVLAPKLDETGALAYVEGVVESPSYIGRWGDDGAPTLRKSIRRSIGRSTILLSAAYEGNRLLFVDWLPGAPCGSEGALACGLRAASPVFATP